MKIRKQSPRPLRLLGLAVTALALAGIFGAPQANATTPAELKLCAKADKRTQAIRDGSPVKIRFECARSEVVVPTDIVIPGDMYIPGEMYIVNEETIAYLKALGERLERVQLIAGLDLEPIIPGDMYTPDETHSPGEMYVINDDVRAYLAEVSKRLDALEIFFELVPPGGDDTDEEDDEKDPRG